MSSEKKSPVQIAENWDKVVEYYDAGFRPTTDLYAEEAVRLLPPASGHRVLDVAAGSGAMSFAAAASGADVLAVDFSPAMLAHLEKTAAEGGIKNVRARVMDGQALDLPDDEFHIAYSMFGLMFFPDQDRGFREMARVLKPGGRAGVYIWRQKSELFEYVIRALQTAAPEFPIPSEPPPYARLAEPESLEKIMLESGFSRAHHYLIARPWIFESARKLWSHLPKMSPAISFIFDHISSEQAQAMGKVLVEELEERFGDGPVAMNAEAIFGLGTK